MPITRPLAILLLVVAAALAACGAPGPTPSSAVIGPAPTPGPPEPSVAVEPSVAPEPTAVPGGPSVPDAQMLVSLETRGGECPNGPCGTKAVIYRDGTVDRSDGMAQRVDPMSLELLVRGIEQADWDAILAVPFTGECPVNYDGQEQVYTFNVDGRLVVVAGCTTAFDPSTEPFATVQGILFGSGG